MVKTCVLWLPQTSKISIIPRNFNFTSDFSIHVIITCQCIFVPVSAFADYFSLLVQHIKFISEFIRWLRVIFALFVVEGFFMVLISCFKFCVWYVVKIFIWKFFELISAWYSVFSLKHFSCKGQSVFLMQLHVLLWLLTGGWRIFLLCELMADLIFDMQL